MAKNTSKSSLAASVAAMAMKYNGRKGADDGKQPFENRESQKAISIRNLEVASSKPGLSNKRLDCGSLRSHNLTLFVGLPCWETKPRLHCLCSWFFCNRPAQHCLHLLHLTELSVVSPCSTAGTVARDNSVSTSMKPFPSRSIKIRLTTIEVIFGQRFVSITFKQLHHFRYTR